MLEPSQVFALIVVVTVAASAVIVSDEVRRRAFDARVLSALWILEPGGSVSLLRFLFGPGTTDEELRLALRRLERARLVRADYSGRETAYGATPAGLYALERGGLGMRGLVGGLPTG